MIQNIGIDIISNKKIKKMISKEKFILKILSIKEYEYYQLINNDKRKIEYIAGRWTAKEAIIKSLLNTYNNWNYTDLTILNDEFGRPYLISDLIKEKIIISISHCDEYTVSVALNKEE